MQLSFTSMRHAYRHGAILRHITISPEPASESTRTASFLQGRIQKRLGCRSAGRWKDIRTHSWFFIRIAILWSIGVKPCRAFCVVFSQTCLPKRKSCGASDLWRSVGLGHLQWNVWNVGLSENRLPRDPLVNHYPGLSLLQHIKELKAHFQTTPYSQLPCLPGRGSCSWDVCASECRHICWPGVQGLSNWSPVVLVRCMVSPAMWCGGWWKHNDLRHRDSFSRTV